MAKLGNERSWITLSDAIQYIIESSHLDIFSAADLIEEGLRKRKLRARARAVKSDSSVQENESVHLPRAPSNAKFEELPLEFWTQDTQFSVDLYEELRSTRYVSIIGSRHGNCEIDELQIRLADLRRWLLLEGSVSISPSLRGAPPKEQAWAFLINILIEETRDSGLTQSEFPDAGSLMRLIVDEWGEREDNLSAHESTKDHGVLSTRSIAAVIKDVWTTSVRGFELPSESRT